MESYSDFSDFDFEDHSDECLSPPVVSQSYIDQQDEDDVASTTAAAEESTNNLQVVEAATNPPPRDHTQVQENTPRSVYLITYSQADVLKVQSRSQFGELIAKEFKMNDDSAVVQWVSSAELHRTEGVHYHCAIKLKSPRRWKAVRQNICSKHGIDVDFLGFHDTYYDAYGYVTKHDSHYVTSEGHVDLDNRPPQTAAAIRSKRVTQVASTKPAKIAKRAPRLDNVAVFGIITKNNLTTDKHLCAFATKQVKEGKDDLQRWVMNHPNPKTRNDILATAWQMMNADKIIEREEKSRIEILIEKKESDHRTDPDTGITCRGEWLEAALEVLNLNNISVTSFCSSIRECLEKGRGKGRNLMIIGGTNRAKSFMFLPLLYIYDCFTCPSDGTFNWVGAHEKEVLLFNDIRYGGNGEGDRKFMAWRMFLNLLEGAPINIPMPKNHFASDVEWIKRQPIFATSEQKIIRIMNHRVDDGETEQMNERWQYVEFNHRFDKKNINYDLVHCPRCFAELVLNNS